MQQRNQIIFVAFELSWRRSGKLVLTTLMCLLKTTKKWRDRAKKLILLPSILNIIPKNCCFFVWTKNFCQYCKIFSSVAQGNFERLFKIFYTYNIKSSYLKQQCCPMMQVCPISKTFGIVIHTHIIQCWNAYIGRGSFLNNCCDPLIFSWNLDEWCFWTLKYPDNILNFIFTFVNVHSCSHQLVACLEVWKTEFH